MVHVWAAIIVIGQLSRQQQLPLYACLKDCRNRLSVEITMLVLVWCTNNQGGKEKPSDGNLGKVGSLVSNTSLQSPETASKHVGRALEQEMM